MISFKHLYKTYSGNVQALRNIDLEIEQGEFVFMTGPSGAGKTTLFKMISAFDKPTSGQISVVGYDLNLITPQRIPYFRRKIGVVFQDFKLLPNKTVYENVALPLEVKFEKKNIVLKKVNEILEQVGLRHKSDQFPEMLSGGEQQRTAIARSLIHQPGILVADEPTGNLDPELSEEIMDLLEKVCAQGTTVFVATHDHDLVKRRKKRTIHIQDGMILSDTGILR